MRFKSENRANISKAVFAEIGAAQTDQPRRGYNFRVLAMAACIVFIIAVGTLGAYAAGIINPSEIHRAFFGDGAENIGFGVNAVAEKNGVEIRLVSAVADGKNFYAFVDIAHEREYLIKEIASKASSDINGLFGGALWMEGCSIANIDEHNASLVLQFRSNHAISVGEIVNIEIPSLQVGYFTSYDTGINLAETDIPDTESSLGSSKPTDYTVPLDSKYDVAKCKEWEDTIPWLAKDQTNIPIVGMDGAAISNIGYVDGKFHVQFKLADQFMLGGVGFNLLGKNGEEIPLVLKTLVSDEVGNCMEFIYDIDRETLKTCSLIMKRGYADADATVEGPWKLQFKVASEVSSISIKDKGVDITVSPIETDIQIRGNVQLCNGILEAKNYILLSDGTRIPLKPSSSALSINTGDGTMRFVSEFYDIERFESVVLGGVEYRK
jgi:hypothetical protein